jgi:hypothetical protein
MSVRATPRSASTEGEDALAAGRRFKIKPTLLAKPIRGGAPPGRKVTRVTPVRPERSKPAIARALLATPGARELIDRIPAFAALGGWIHIASFTVRTKSGTARYLDLWDADHFDGYTDMPRCVADNRAWFSDRGYASWGSRQTRTGVINCYFTIAQAANHICCAQLQSVGGPAEVECLIDGNSFGFLPFNGIIIQPHPCALASGGHSFQIRQRSGAFFFICLSVWRV